MKILKSNQIGIELVRVKFCESSICYLKMKEKNVFEKNFVSKIHLKNEIQPAHTHDKSVIAVVIDNTENRIFISISLNFSE